eukprot:1159309-Pelagomonas_calceolata.AAC.4
MQAMGDWGEALDGLLTGGQDTSLEDGPQPPRAASFLHPDRVRADTLFMLVSRSVTLRGGGDSWLF